GRRELDGVDHEDEDEAQQGARPDVPVGEREQARGRGASVHLEREFRDRRREAGGLGGLSSRFAHTGGKTDRTAAITRSRSASVIAEPDGRLSPVANSRSATRPPKAAASRNNGWQCSGFHSGRASMLSSARARSTRSRSVPAAAGSIVRQVSQ